MANYTLAEAIPKFKELLENAGVEEVKLLEDNDISRKACNRILIGKLSGNEIAVICFPIVLRNADAANKIHKQRYIDINSSAWGGYFRILEESVLTEC